MARKWWTLIAVSVATFMLLLDITVVNMALPSIQKTSARASRDLQWVIDAYTLTLAAVVLTAGSLADRFGRRRRVRRWARDLLGGLAARRAGARRDVPELSHAPCRASAAPRCSPCRWPWWRRSSRPAGSAATAMGMYGATIGVAVAVGPLVGGVITDGARLALGVLPQRPDRHRRDRGDLR